jgi:uncharacterized membrane protein (UPF0182 family)
MVLIAGVLLLVVPSAVTYYTDWLWFRELGYEGIFLRTLNAQTLVFLSTATVVFLFLYLNFRVARGTFRRPHIVLGTGVDGRPIALEGRHLTGVALPAALVIAGGLALASASNWLTWLNYFNAVPFGDRDPLFGRDVSFYVFKLPLLQIVRQQALFSAFAALIGCALYYVLSGSFVIEQRPNAGILPKFRLIPVARRHLGLLAALVFALLAWGAWLDRFDTLLTPAEVIFGASYADVNARMPFLWASIVVLGAGAALAVYYGFSRASWPLPIAIAAYFVVSVTGTMYAAILQRFIVTPNELDKEQPYIVNNIAATRRAYALDNVEEREVSGDALLTAKDIVANAATIQNVRLWDHEPLLQTFTQIQEIRTYYDFRNVDNDRYTLLGKPRQVMLSVRELNTESMQNRSWVNERLVFTHGYALTLGPVNEVTTEGLPVLFIRDLPPTSTVDIKLDEPSVYFGELSNDYVLVRTRQPEFHYPRGDDNVTTEYHGSGGVGIGSLIRRLLFAIRFANTNILVTNTLTSDSRILFHRRISERVQHLAPFLTFDTDPYPVISEGRIFWIQDAYTTTANYPYSTPQEYRGGPLNYIRNSVKIVVDAYHGSTTFYLAEPADPLALTLANIFPGMMKPMSDMPADLRRHVRYPEDIFRVQSIVFQQFHMTNPAVFYNREDQWQTPALDVGGNSVPMQPYYMIMRLPGEREPEFLQMLPFTPRLKENLAAWMVARSDPTHYGRLLVYQFPKQKIVYGPKQINGRINQDQVISPQITLWNQQGSQVIWGTLLVIPIDESLLYVRPLYLRSPEGRIPELKRVIVAYQSQIVMKETLVEALSEIFGPAVAKALAPDRLASTATSVVQTPREGTAPPIETPAPAGDAAFAALVAEFRQHVDRADRALRDGDLVLYGEEWKKIKAVLEKMEKAKR